MAKFNRRNWLEQRFSELYVGDLEELSDMPDDKLESMVRELSLAQINNRLDLSTSTGVDMLQKIVDKYVIPE